MVAKRWLTLTKPKVIFRYRLNTAALSRGRTTTPDSRLTSETLSSMQKLTRLPLQDVFVGDARSRRFPDLYVLCPILSGDCCGVESAKAEEHESHDSRPHVYHAGTTVVVKKKSAGTPGALANCRGCTSVLRIWWLGIFLGGDTTDLFYIEASLTLSTLERLSPLKSTARPRSTSVLSIPLPHSFTFSHDDPRERHDQ